ncbi:hypothetical protein J6590_011280 [Homalodisca vitripennis]|nr:hypothetical protein J6590_011280 [Homalodisca vitripennis]
MIPCAMWKSYLHKGCGFFLGVGLPFSASLTCGSQFQEPSINLCQAVLGEDLVRSTPTDPAVCRQQVNKVVSHFSVQDQRQSSGRLSLGLSQAKPQGGGRRIFFTVERFRRAPNVRPPPRDMTAQQATHYVPICKVPSQYRSARAILYLELWLFLARAQVAEVIWV